jgi:O-antigen ligase
MKAEDKNMLWRASAVFLGAALPSTLILKPGLMYGLVGLGLVTGLAATKGESLRGSVRLMLDSWVVLLVVVMMGAFLVSCGLGIDPGYAFDKWLQLLAGIAVAGGLFILLRQMPGLYVEALLKSMAVTAFCAMGLALLDVLLDEPRLSIFLHGPDKGVGDYRLNFFSGVLAVILPYVWARLLTKAKEGEPFAQRIALPGAAVSLLTLIVCGGRAGWVGGAVAVLVFLYAAGRWHKLVVHARHWLYVMGVVAAGLGIYGLVYGKDFLLQRLMLEPEGGRGPLSGRLEVWARAWSHVGDHPVFGIGPMNYRNLPDAVDLHPHDWVLQLVLETGFVGFGLFAVLMGLIWYRFSRYAHANLYGVAALSSLSAFLVAGLANTSIFNMWWVAFLAFTCLLGWRAGWAGESQHKRRKGRTINRRMLVAEGK